MNKNIWVLVITLGLSAYIGYSDLQQTDTPITAILILISAFVIGIMVTKQAWVFGILIGLGVPITGFVALINQWQLVGIGHGQTIYWTIHSRDWIGSWLAVVIGLVGVYLGQGTRKLLKLSQSN